MSYEQASVIVTGGSKGIGLEIAKFFASNTNRPIVLLARNVDELERTKIECEEAGAKSVDILSVDLTDLEALKAIDFQKLNPAVLVNNAGTFLFKKLEDTTQSEFINQFEINTLSAFNMTKVVLPLLKQQERGLIVNICSQASLKGYADSGAYTMSKHALLGYTRSLRKELMPTNVAVSAINLGQTYSTSWEGVDIDPNELIDPVDVARIIHSLTELSPRSVAEEINLMPKAGETKPM
ncbi:SDR family NAD(P)-dependent oxidoreductase [Balneola vulgaris]|uniref:SDR family NAD(P)-dependent oxidoreductase n=1 Tax=Balneola vulgaris TaxID=287535 RepID=UPI000380D424|nr:SDR family oxidoreductase [Balneola vulgaris]